MIERQQRLSATASQSQTLRYALLFHCRFLSSSVQATSQVTNSFGGASDSFVTEEVTEALPPSILSDHASATSVAVGLVYPNSFIISASRAVYEYCKSSCVNPFTRREGSLFFYNGSHKAFLLLLSMFRVSVFHIIGNQ
jgi:hypothetical protein